MSHTNHHTNLRDSRRSTEAQLRWATKQDKRIIRELRAGYPDLFS